jgi:hypothetical protein
MPDVHNMGHRGSEDHHNHVAVTNALTLTLLTKSARHQPTYAQEHQHIFKLLEQEEAASHSLAAWDGVAL